MNLWHYLKRNMDFNNDIMRYSDVFWFVDNILTKDLMLPAGEIYNKFKSLQEIRDLKNLYFSEKKSDYIKIINDITSS